MSSSQFRVTTVDENRHVCRYSQFLESGVAEQLSYRDFLERWRNNFAFTDWFTHLIADAPFDAFFWETPPITTATLDLPFECVLVETTALAGASPEPDVFQEHFRSATDGFASFWNLGNDALLIAPVANAAIPLASHAHLAAFLRAAPSELTQALWRAVAQAARARLSDRPLWMSTSGLGVAWLHVRFDAKPKYYQYSAYRDWPR